MPVSRAPRATYRVYEAQEYFACVDLLQPQAPRTARAQRPAIRPMRAIGYGRSAIAGGLLGACTIWVLFHHGGGGGGTAHGLARAGRAAVASAGTSSLVRPSTPRVIARVPA